MLKAERELVRGEKHCERPHTHTEEKTRADLVEPRKKLSSSNILEKVQKKNYSTYRWKGNRGEASVDSQ